MQQADDRTRRLIDAGAARLTLKSELGTRSTFSFTAPVWTKAPVAIGR